MKNISSQIHLLQDLLKKRDLLNSRLASSENQAILLNRITKELERRYKNKKIPSKILGVVSQIQLSKDIKMLCSIYKLVLTSKK